MNLLHSLTNRRRGRDNQGELPIASLIDIVFLLLMYFMLSSTIEKQEADLRFSLPGVVEQVESLDMPDEQIILIDSQGQAILNDSVFKRDEHNRYSELAATLTRFNESGLANKSAARVVIAPQPKTRHEYIIGVMDACSFAGIQDVSFAN